MGNLYEIFRSPNVLNIFSDASLRARGNETDICYGAVVVCGDEIIDSDYRINSSKTSNYGEAQGVLLALNFAVKYKDIYPVINIFSDSQITIFNIRDRYMNWRYHKDNYYNKSTGIVQNQSVFVEMIRIICDNDLHVNFFHMKGHVEQRKFDDIKKATDVFISSNRISGIKVDYAFIRYISNYNTIVDITSRSILARTDIVVNRYYCPFTFKADPNLLDKYKNKKLKEIRANGKRNQRK